MKNIHNSEQMGSQMMNYACLYYYCKKYGHNVGLQPESAFGKFSSKIIADSFTYNFNYVNNVDDMIHINEYPYNQLDNIDKNKNYFVHGLFHRAISVWSSIKEDIRDNFYNFNNSILVEAKNKINYFKQKNKTITSVHFRRRDYVTLGAALKLDYYKNAVNQYNADDIFLVFSDDIEWCKSIKDEVFGNRNVFFSENNKQNIDMCMASLCDNNIVSNSTFSIWSAALNKNSKAKIVSTKFAPGGCDLSLAFQNWKILTSSIIRN
jgi:hypothetical protein